MRVAARSRGYTPQTARPSWCTCSMMRVASSLFLPKNFCSTLTTNSMGV
ncbi:Uncharacterised protein [Bordetella pertussis]|nr:Uncharacterised protein [Bordetella pertussis]